MAKFSTLKNSFNLGQFSKRVFGLSNIQEYNSGADTLKNVIPLSTGGVRRRGGSRYLNTTDTHFGITGSDMGTSYSSQNYRQICRLVPLTFSNGTGFLYLDDSERIRFGRYFWDDDETIPNCNRVVPTAHSFVTSNGDMEVGITNDANLNINEIKHTQVGDFVYVVSGTSCPFYIGWDGNASTTAFIKNIFSNPSASFNTALQNRVPYRLNTESGFNLTPSGTTGNITLTASDDLFDSAMIGQTIFRLNDGYVVITAVASATSATAEVQATLSGTSATDEWEESEWSDYRGWPTEIVFFEQRLYYFRDSKIWASQSGDVSQMALDQGATINADSPFSFELGLDSNEKICWVNASRTLVIGTTEAEYIITGPDSNSSISATNFSARRETQHGSFVGAPSIRVDNALYFIDRTGSNIREFVFDERENAFRTQNITRLCGQDFFEKNFRDISGPTGLEPERVKILDMYRQIDTDNIIWIRTNAFGLFSITIDRQTNTYAPAEHVMGGSSEFYSEPLVNAMCCTGDNVWLIVERLIDGSTVRTLEAIFPQYNKILSSVASDTRDMAEEFMWYVDCGYTDNGSNITVHDGLSHLEGEEVSIVSDNQYFVGTGTVSSGEVTSPRTSTRLVAGLKYESKVKLLPPNPGTPYGSGEGLVRRIERVVIRFFRTIAASVGIDTGETGFDDITFRTADQALGDPIPLFSGLKTVEIAYTEEDHQVVIKTDKPLPMEISAITIKGQTYE